MKLMGKLKEKDMQRIECELDNKEYALSQMRKRLEMEKPLLERLDSGLLDGVIGSGFNMGTLTSRAMIENGKPMLVKYLTEKGPVKDAMIIEKEFETVEGKLWFLRNHGWKMEDVYAQLYSRIYKRHGSY